jgi:hypothetical protein
MIVFENAGEIDVLAISTFGVSAKEGDSPIGFFGTGLKYAIAVLLREGVSITIYSGRDVIEFDVLADNMRGKKFDFVRMSVDGGNPQPIGFTTELGKQWEMWMAYREIACNCKDENGRTYRANDWPAPETGKTKIIVKGASFEEVHAKSHFYILEDQPQFTIDDIEVRSRPGTGFYYRGVRVHEFGQSGLFTYNDLSTVELTEDRTVKDQYVPAYHVARAILQSSDRLFLRQVLIADENTFEGHLDFHGWGVSPSAEFLSVTGDCMADRMLKVNRTAMKVWKDATKKNFTPREINLTAVQRMSLERALDFCERIGFQIRGSYPIKFVESLGEGGLGLAQDETIFIAERVLHMGGTKQLASTLIEEYVHLRHGWKDMTRELQTFLFDKLVSVGEELVGSPL